MKGLSVPSKGYKWEEIAPRLASAKVRFCSLRWAHLGGSWTKHSFTTGTNWPKNGFFSHPLKGAKSHHHFERDIKPRILSGAEIDSRAKYKVFLRDLTNGLRGVGTFVGIKGAFDFSPPRGETGAVIIMRAFVPSSGCLCGDEGGGGHSSKPALLFLADKAQVVGDLYPFLVDPKHKVEPNRMGYEAMPWSKSSGRRRGMFLVRFGRGLSPSFYGLSRRGRAPLLHQLLSGDGGGKGERTS